MRKLTFKCDGCGKTVEADSRTPDLMPKGWQTLTVSYAHVGTVGAAESDEGGAASHELCGECVGKIVKAINKPSLIAKTV